MHICIVLFSDIIMTELIGGSYSYLYVYVVSGQFFGLLFWKVDITAHKPHLFHGYACT